MTRHDLEQELLEIYDRALVVQRELTDRLDGLMNTARELNHLHLQLAAGLRQLHEIP